MRPGLYAVTSSAPSGHPMVVIPTLRLRELQLREEKELAYSHRAGNGRARIVTRRLFLCHCRVTAAFPL